jgi:rhodanese-related sulfurtransferase
MKSIFSVLLLLVGITMYSCAQSPKSQVAQVLTAADFKAKLAATPNAILLDVRRPDEIAGGKIDGSINIVYGEPNFEAELAKLDHTKPIFIYCAGGVRSAKSCPSLEKNGFKTIYDLKGGYASWR